MTENLLVAFSNFPCVYPISQSYDKGDYLTTSVIAFVSIASFVSHLIENHKHGMPGIGFSKKVSYYSNRLDVLGCVLAGSRFAYLYYAKYGLPIDIILANKLTFLLLTGPVILLKISEYDKYNPKLKYRYIITHSIWHMSIFMAMNYFLSTFIYS
jgi:hypothetical protein